MLNFTELKEFLDEKADLYNDATFIIDDPVQFAHRYTLHQDVEIASFFAATIAWGNRKSIIKSAENILDTMGNSPFDFVMNHRSSDLDVLKNKAIHRTFNGEDFAYFITRFKEIYQENETLEKLFLLAHGEENFKHSIERFRNRFLGSDSHRTHKHVSSPYKNSSSKRIMMFLRWMVRKDQRGVDLGIWKNIDQKYLSVPLDVHTGNISRKLGLVTRSQNDWKTVEELDHIIRRFDAQDPAKYDFALFGLGVTKDFV